MTLAVTHTSVEKSKSLPTSNVSVGLAAGSSSSPVREFSGGGNSPQDAQEVPKYYFLPLVQKANGTKKDFFFDAYTCGFEGGKNKR